MVRRMFSCTFAVVAAAALLVAPGAVAAAQSGGDVGVERLSGSDRYETSLAVARRFVAESGGSIDAAVVVSGRSWQDAVVAAGLAGSLDAPVLLTPKDGLTESTSSFLESAGASELVVVGDSAAVSEEALEAMRSVGSVSRVFGSDASAASVSVAQRMGTPGVMPGHGVTVIVASSTVFADAMVAGGFSARGGHPVLLTPPDSLDERVGSYVSTSGAEHVVILGGEAAVSGSVEADIKALGVSVTRLGGTTRLDTALKVADFLEGKYSEAADGRCFDRSTAGLATAWVPFDAFSAGPLLGALCAPLLLTDPKAMDPDVASWIKDGTGDVVVFGGLAAVSAGALAAVSDEAALEVLFDDAARQRARIVAELTRGIRSGAYGIDADNVLRGPAGFEIDLDDCPQGWSDTAGVTRSEIRIGYSAPISGSLSQFGRIGSGMENYFDWVNANDPVAGRRITLVTKDDAYDASRTIDNVNALIDAENVFSIQTLGTPNTFAVYDSINYECIPHPFAQTGHPAWGDPVIHPWTTGSQMSYSTEAVLWGQWIKQNLASELPVKVAALVWDHDFGSNYELAFAVWAQANPDVVSEFVAVHHHPSESSTEDLADELQEVADADPDVYISMTPGPACLSAIQLADTSGLTGAIRTRGGALFTPSVCRGIDAYVKPAGSAAEGWHIVGGGSKDTTDAAVADEPFVRFLNANLNAAGYDTSDSSLYGHGYVVAYPHVEALRIAAELPGGLTRTNLILAVRSLDIDHPLYLDGIRYRLNGAADGYPVESSEILEYDATDAAWNQVGDVIDIAGQSPNCVWIRSSLQGTRPRCGTTTRDRLTTMAVNVDANGGATRAWAYAYDADRDGREDELKPGYWKATGDSFCVYHADEWRIGSELGNGWVEVNGEAVEFDQTTRIRIENLDMLAIETWGGEYYGANSCQLDWVAELD